MTTPKRLLVLGGKLHPYGGMETHIYEFCSAMVTEPGVQISLVLSSKDYSRKWISALRLRGVRVLEFDCTSRLAGKIGYLRCLAWLALRRPRGAVLYSNGTSGFALAAARALKPPLWIHHHHSDVTPEILKGFSNNYRKVLIQCHEAIACTPRHAELISAEFRPGRPARFLPYFKPEPKQPFGRSKENSGKLIIGFFGRMRRSKGIPILLDLANWFQENGIECRLHGDDCEGIVKGGLPPGLKWMGAYDAEADLDHLLSDIDIAVLPTTFPEGLPLVVTEAISRGVPVVAFDGGGLRELTSFHKGLIVTPPTAAAFKNGLQQMRMRLADPLLHDSLAAAYRSKLGNNVAFAWWKETLGRIP